MLSLFSNNMFSILIYLATLLTVVYAQGINIQRPLEVAISEWNNQIQPSSSSWLFMAKVFWVERRPTLQWQPISNVSRRLVSPLLRLMANSIYHRHLFRVRDSRVWSRDMCSIWHLSTAKDKLWSSKIWEQFLFISMVLTLKAGLGNGINLKRDKG